LKDEKRGPVRRKAVAKEPKPQSAPIALNIDLSADWNEIPLLSNLTNHISAKHRCSLLPELKVFRKQVVERLTAEIDGIFLPAGYARKGLVWTKNAAFEAQPVAPEVSPRGLFGKIVPSWLTSRASAAVTAAGWNDGAVSFEIQRSKWHNGFFMNVLVRKCGAHDQEATYNAVEGFKTYRSQSFIRDMPRNFQIDEYYYVRLAEDERYFVFLLSLIEKRIFPFLETYAANKVSLPGARDMEKSGPLLLPEQERRRFFEAAPTQKMFENLASISDHFSFFFRDGRHFHGQAKSIENGKLFLSWTPYDRAYLPSQQPPLPPDQWVEFHEIDHGSLMYRERDTQHLKYFELPVADV
jgi:hypothetical protein